jgi:putative peptidoglycan lipid II flippase
VKPETPPPASQKEAGLLESAGVVSLAVATSRITGLLRESVLAWLFGASGVFDAYVLAYRIPNLARDLFAEGALSSAFVPEFTRYLTSKSRAEARELSNVTSTLLLAIVGIVVLLGIAFSPQFVTLFAPGFRDVPGKWELAVRLTRTMFPFLLLVALAAQAQGVLNACHRFGVPAVSSAMFNLGSVFFGLAVGYWFGPQLGVSAVEGMALGIVFGGAAQLAFQLPSVWRAGFAWRPQWNLRHPGVRRILALMGPALIGSASVHINLLVNTSLAAGIRDAAGHVINGPVSWLAYAFRFMQLPIGLFGVALGSAMLPRIAKNAAHGDLAQFRDTLSRALVSTLLLTIPSSVGLAILGDSMIGLIFERGRFTAFDTRETALALACYAIGLAGFSALKLLAPAFYALGDSRTPMFVSLASVAVNLVFAVMLVRVFGLGHAGLALSTSAVSWFSSFALLALIRGRIGGVRGRELLSGVIKISLAALVMGAACYALVHYTATAIPGVKLRRAVNLSAGIPLGALVWFSVASALRIPELAEARTLILRRLIPSKTRPNP